MAHVDIQYDLTDRKAADEKAIQDVKDYCERMFRPGAYETLIEEIKNPANDVTTILRSVELFMGISGYPLGALMRKYRLEDWKADCARTGHPTDEEGYILPKPKKDPQEFDLDDMMEALQEAGLSAVAIGFEER